MQKIKQTNQKSGQADVDWRKARENARENAAVRLRDWLRKWREISSQSKCVTLSFSVFDPKQFYWISKTFHFIKLTTETRGYYIYQKGTHPYPLPAR